MSNRLPSSPLMLSIERGPEAGKRFRIVSSSISVGREIQNDIVLTDLKVSRFHLSIKLEQGQYKIFDLSQKAQLKINGLLVQEAALQLNDVIEIGDTFL